MTENRRFGPLYGAKRNRYSFDRERRRRRAMLSTSTRYESYNNTGCSDTLRECDP